jgi:hypothetical protein
VKEHLSGISLNPTNLGVLDGSDPSQIVEGTGAAAPTGGANTNGASAFSRSATLGLVASSLVALSAAFVVLA